MNARVLDLLFWLPLLDSNEGLQINSLLFYH